MPNQKPITILLVEDDPGHSRLILKNLKRAGILNEIFVAENGQKALDILFKQGDFSNLDTPLPGLVLLDLNLPVVDGFQVLEKIKSTSDTQNIPVVMLTTTDNPDEIERCYTSGANAYVVKPVEYGQFSEVIKTLGLFLSIVTTPKR